MCNLVKRVGSARCHFFSDISLQPYNGDKEVFSLLVLSAKLFILCYEKTEQKNLTPCGDYFLKLFFKKYIKIFFIFLNLFLYHHIKMI
jgi:predicted GTPase